MKKLLLTGFDPFLNYSMNPTQEIVRALAGEDQHLYDRGKSLARRL